MKIDHLVVNVDKKYQADKDVIENIRQSAIPYEPSWGKGTKGFKASNIWIGNEYFEMIRILKTDGGGWIPDWTKLYNQGHRGMICLMLDVEDIDKEYQRLLQVNIKSSKPEWLEFKWFFNLLTRRMPWQNCYLPFFEGVPFQLGLQQMKDQKARDFMSAYMVPNTRDTGITGIKSIAMSGPFTDRDFKLIANIFPHHVVSGSNTIQVQLDKDQKLSITRSDAYTVEVETDSDKQIGLQIETVTLK